MFTKGSKLSAPIAGVVLLAAIGFTSSALAAPQPMPLHKQSGYAEFTIQLDNKRGDARQLRVHDKNKAHRHNGRGRPDHYRGHWGPGTYELGPRQIRRSLRHRGFHKIRLVDRRGPMYIVKARSWDGQRYRLVVDSRNAHIVRSKPIRPHRQHYWYGEWRF